MRWREYPRYKPSGVEWLGEVPEDWRTLRLKYTASINDEVLPESTDPDYEIQYVDISSVDAVEGIKKKEIMRFVEAPSRARRRVRDGDVIVSTVRTYLRAIAPIHNPEENLIVSTGFAVIRPKREVNGNFAAYALRAPYFVESVVARSVGVSYPAINAGEIGTLRIAIPPGRDQRAIAAFLDRETGRLDALVEKKRRQIELLQEKRAALISHAVTKGLDPTAKMKDSGIEGLGGVPAHWQMKRLKFLTPQVTVGIVVTPSQYYVDSGIPCLRSLNVREDTLTETDLVFISPESNELLCKSKLNLGDLVAVRTGQPGTTAVVNETFDGANCIDLIIIRKSAKFDSRFMCYVMNSEFSKAQYLSGSSGAIQAHFNIETASNMLVPVAPFSEQVQIRKHLDVEIGNNIALRQKIESSISTLREYRTALISATVTGKIDVRGEVRKAPAAFHRIVLAAEIVHRLHHDPHFGRVKLQKVLYLCEHHLGMDLQGNYWRQAAGPLDNRMLHSVEKQLERQKWFAPLKNGWGIKYAPLEKAGGHRKYFDNYWADYRERLDSLLELMRPLNTEQSEIVATLFAAWNDLVIAGRPFTDEDILHEVRSNWHESKERFDEDRLRRALKWMRDQGLVPQGLGRATRTGHVTHGGEEV